MKHRQTIESVAHNPFHRGEVQAQARAGVGDMAARVAGFIRDYMPEQHREFFGSLPFLVASAADSDGRPWVTILEGGSGFITSPDASTLVVDTELDHQDPLTATFTTGSDIGLLGIEPATRRRNRLSGHFHRTSNGYAIGVHQSFGNCPQYIHEREWYRVQNANPTTAIHTSTLSVAQMDRIGCADTLFIGTGQHAGGAHPSNGYDASHRGGKPGFAEVLDSTHLRIPDYSGNNFFNTIGNLLVNPKVGLLFVDFESGGLLQISGHATVDWQPRASRDPGALRTIKVSIDRVIDRPRALSLRWRTHSEPSHRLTVIDKVVESNEVTSVYLASADNRPLAPFSAGQHLPIEIELTDFATQVSRSYSLSGAPDTNVYRLSIKREPQGLVSRYLHDVMDIGDYIHAGAPSGDFVVSCAQCPLVLVSAGIGITPTLAILHDVAKEPGTRPVWFVHGARNKEQHSFRDEVSALTRARPGIAKLIHYSQPGDQDRLGIDYDAKGRISAQTLLDLNVGPEAHYFLCGPPGFVSDIQTGLDAAGVLQGHIHFETF